jgi:multiple sugar transport system permease protein
VSVTVTDPPAAPSVVRARRSRAGRSQWRGLAFILPIGVLFAVFRFWPMVDAFWLSFHDYDLLTESEWIGLENYRALLSDPLFLQSLRVTAYYVIGTCIPLWVLSLGLAMMLNRSMRGKGLFRVIIFLPAIVPAVVLPVLWRFLYHPYGLVNRILESLGLSGVNWLTDSASVIPAFILTSEWRFVPLFAIIYLAGLQGIPAQYYEAAEIDGARAPRRFFSITLPMLRPTIAVVVIVSVTLTAKTLVLALLMTNGGPSGASRVLSLFVYQTGFQFLKLGYASAASMVLLAIMLVFTVVQLRLLRVEKD